MNTTAIIKNAKGRNETANKIISDMRENVEALQDALENWGINAAKKAAESTLRQHNKWERAIQADRMNTREVYTTEYRDSKELEEIVAMDDEMVKDLTKVQGETAKVVRDIRDAHKIAKIEAEQAQIEAEQAQIEADMAEGKKAAANLKVNAEWEAAKKAEWEAAKKAAAEKEVTDMAEGKKAAEKEAAEVKAPREIMFDTIIKNAKGRNEMAKETISAMRKNVEALQDALENWGINAAKKAAESTLRQHNKWERAIKDGLYETDKELREEREATRNFGFNDIEEVRETKTMQTETAKDLWEVHVETEKAVRDIFEAAVAEEAREAAAKKAAAENISWVRALLEVTEEVEAEEAAEVKALREQLKKAEAERDEARAEVKAIREQLNETEEVHAEAAEGEAVMNPEANEDETETTKEDDEIERAVLNAQANDARAQEYMEEMKMNIERARVLLTGDNVLTLEKSDATKLVRENNKIAKRYEDNRTGAIKDLLLNGKGNDAVRECMDMEENTQSEMDKLQRETKEVADEIRRIAA